MPVKVVRKLISPIEDFLKTESSGGIILMINAIVAMVWANSPFFHSYEAFIEFPLGLKIGAFEVTKSLHHWVNDGLMVIFFFVVGLEIKRELILGELSTPKKAALPMFAALGGMIVPAGIYAMFNHGGPGSPGWGIPMATDIAFAVGVLSLVSKRVPFALKIFLLALAIVDDLGAVLVIAFFYTDNIATNALGVAAFAFILTYMFRTAGVKNILVYVFLGIIAWFAVLKSGVHATIAGVVLGLMTPIAAYFEKVSLPEKLTNLVQDIVGDITGSDKDDDHLSHSTQLKMAELKETSTHSVSPLDRLIHALHPWVSYFIMPLFALVNAGVHIENIDLQTFLANPVALGVILGLFLGKPIGVTLFSYIAIKANLAKLPDGVTWYNMVCVGFLAGIGFTMALFVGHLALGGSQYETFSKLGILVASLLAGVTGSALMIMARVEDKKEASS